MSSLLFALLACGTPEIPVRGRVEHARVREGQFWALEAGTIGLLTQDGALYSSATTNEDGRFALNAPSGQTVFATVDGPDLATSSFTGITGAPNTGALVIGIDEDQDSALYGVLLTQIDELKSDFEGCPGIDEPGGIVFGEVRVIGITDPVTDEEPLVNTAEVSLSAEEEDARAACHLDDAGVFDPDATLTGATGRFALFGVPSGRWTMTVRYSAFVDSTIETPLDVWVPDADVAVVPRQPAWVEFPF